MRCAARVLSAQVDGKLLGYVSMLETDDIIAYFAELHGKPAEGGWAFRYYVDGAFAGYKSLFGYMMKGEGGYPAALAWFKESSNVTATTDGAMVFV